MAQQFIFGVLEVKFFSLRNNYFAVVNVAALLKPLLPSAQ
jgi:hypothetical protein